MGVVDTSLGLDVLKREESNGSLISWGFYEPKNKSGPVIAGALQEAPYRGRATVKDLEIEKQLKKVK